MLLGDSPPHGLAFAILQSSDLTISAASNVHTCQLNLYESFSISNVLWIKSEVKDAWQAPSPELPSQSPAQRSGRDFSAKGVLLGGVSAGDLRRLSKNAYQNVLHTLRIELSQLEVRFNVPISNTPFFSLLTYARLVPSLFWVFYYINVEKTSSILLLFSFGHLSKPIEPHSRCNIEDHIGQEDSQIPPSIPILRTHTFQKDVRLAAGTEDTFRGRIHTVECEVAAKLFDVGRKVG